MTAPITAIYAALLGILMIGLAYRVVRLRLLERVPLGHGSSKALRRAMRVHGNAAEYLPIILLLLLLFELNGGAVWLLHLFGVAALVARVLHALWLSRYAGTSFGRFYGTIITWVVVVGLAAANLWIALI